MKNNTQIDLINFNSNFFLTKEKHFFHLVANSQLPFITAIGSMLLVLNVVFYLHLAGIVTFYFLDNMMFQIAWTILSSVLFFWFLTVVRESGEGFHTLVVRQGWKVMHKLFFSYNTNFFHRVKFFFWHFLTRFKRKPCQLNALPVIIPEFIREFIQTDYARWRFGYPDLYLFFVIWTIIFVFFILCWFLYNFIGPSLLIRDRAACLTLKAIFCLIVINLLLAIILIVHYDVVSSLPPGYKPRPDWGLTYGINGIFTYPLPSIIVSFKVLLFEFLFMFVFHFFVYGISYPKKWRYWNEWIDFLKWIGFDDDWE